MNRLVATLLSTLLTSALLAVSVPPASAHHREYYGDGSRAVARHIGCTNWYRPADGGKGAYNLDSGVCWLKGKRVNVITFGGPAQQREWNAGARFGLPSDHWWANGKGAVVTARNGNKPAARLGARALPGKLIKAY